MPTAQSIDELRRQLKRRSVHLNTLHALLRLDELETQKKTYRKEREQRVLKLVAMLGGIREPDLVAISRLSQPTLWRLVEGWNRSGAIRVITDYNDHVVGRRAKWLQPPESAEIPDGRRTELVKTAALIKAYIPLWDTEQAEAAQVKASAQLVSQPAPRAVAPITTLPPAPVTPRPAPPPVAPIEILLPVAAVPETPTPYQAPAQPRPQPLAPPSPLWQPPSRLLPRQAVSAPPVGPIYVRPSYPLASPFGPPFTGPDAPVQPRFPWWYTFKLGLGALLLSGVLALVLRFGVTVAEWALIWGIAALWVLAGSSIIGLVVTKQDEWGDLSEPMHQVLSRAAVVLGLGLMLWPSGLAVAGWHAVQASVEAPQPQALPTAPPLPHPAATPEPSPTPATCGQAVITARRGLRLRADPGTDTTVLTTLPRLTQVERLCQSQRIGAILWTLVQAGEHKGWLAEEEAQQRYLVAP